MTFPLYGIALATLVSAGAMAAEAPPGPRRSGFLSGMAPVSAAAKPESLRFTPEGAVAKALEGNRELKAAAQLINEAAGRLDGSGALPNPEFAIGGGPGLHAGGAGIIEASFTQRFPVTGRLRHERALAQSELDAAREEVLIARRRLIGEVKRDAIKLIAAREEIALLRARRANAEKLAASSRARADRGEAGAVEAGFLELESADASDEIARLEAARAVLLAGFRVELGLAPDADADVTGDLPADRDNFGLPDPTACPECRKMTILADAADSAVALERARKWDDIGVGLFVQAEHDALPARHEDRQYAGVRVSVPLPLWQDNAGAVAAARAKRERLRGELTAEIRRLDGLVLAARREYETLSRRLPDLRDKLLPAARAQAERVRSAHAKGEGDPADLYRALDKLGALELRELTLRRDIALALTALETSLSAHPALRDPVVAPPVGE